MNRQRYRQDVSKNIQYNRLIRTFFGLAIDYHYFYSICTTIKIRKWKSNENEQEKDTHTYKNLNHWISLSVCFIPCKRKNQTYAPYSTNATQNILINFRHTLYNCWHRVKFLFVLYSYVYLLYSFGSNSCSRVCLIFNGFVVIGLHSNRFNILLICRQQHLFLAQTDVYSLVIRFHWSC